ncbi:hypothetical protein COCSUDRAFT_41089 [Coccomyxa subellipsoidea C-169]|uniref:Uncharacterized protein n=1 Tax=Coccomyxa subellipsoidea (strain C-169) TaxID=574566 RepID=I0Z2C9_COCSC|nr:hypothetical protein COCSUDRAFT_41089 [Coccomyxa subellipsoidea C-169]EIE24798.1 hypothetical protein COCSUDRAFT_41089 [Coccomyxa subellipsoidea C-169]|eukprot:XP_005649342.1 hypothetical protein COCSUDRAFT_41089 [Coccomyxa subellipsoidea C-169]
MCRRSGQPGRMMRIAACRAEDPSETPPSDLTPNWVTEGIWKVENVVYPLFNKAWAIKQFMEMARPPEEYILVLDSDMLIHKPFLPSNFEVAKGTAASENMDDLERIAPLWFDYTLPVLQSIQRNGQIVETKQSLQRRVWYAEMHAYTLGAAKEGVHHIASNSSVFHLGYYHPHGMPNALHYAWEATVPGSDWAFDKHKHRDFVAEKCPPWDLEGGQEGLFPHPPSPSKLTSKGGERIRNLLNIEVVATLNMAFCELHHNKLCGEHEQAKQECAKASRLVDELQEAWEEIRADTGLTCIDVLVDVKVFPKLSSQFNVESYEIQTRTLMPENSPWKPAGGSSTDVDVGSLQEYTEHEIRGRAQNIRGASEWSKPIRVLTRRKAVEGGCDSGLYKWTQTRGEVVFQLAVPMAVKGRDIKVVIVTLEKEMIGLWWTSALKGHAEIDLHTVPGYDPPPFDPSVYRM